MIDLAWAVLFLGIAVVINWALGIYDKVGVEQIKWDWRTFLRGAVKIVIIAGSVIGLGFAWQYSGIDLSGAGLEPLTLTTTATAYYAYNAIKHLAAIVMGKKKDEDVFEGELLDDTYMIDVEAELKSVTKATDETTENE